MLIQILRRLRLPLLLVVTAALAGCYYGPGPCCHGGWGGGWHGGGGGWSGPSSGWHGGGGNWQGGQGNSAWTQAQHGWGN